MECRPTSSSRRADYFKDRDKDIITVIVFVISFLISLRRLTSTEKEHLASDSPEYLESSGPGLWEFPVNRFRSALRDCGFDETHCQ